MTLTQQEFDELLAKGDRIAKKLQRDLRWSHRVIRLSIFGAAIPGLLLWWYGLLAGGGKLQRIGLIMTFAGCGSALGLLLAMRVQLTLFLELIETRRRLILGNYFRHR